MFANQNFQSNHEKLQHKILFFCGKIYKFITRKKINQYEKFYNEKMCNLKDNYIIEVVCFVNLIFVQ